MSLNFTKTDVNVLLYEVFDDLNDMARNRQLQYELLLPRISLIAFLDKDALRKVLRCLTYNTVRYAESEVSIKLAPFNSEDKLFNIEMRNDGTLIPTEKKLRPHELAELQDCSLTLIQDEGSGDYLRLSIPILQEEALANYSVKRKSLYKVVADKDFIGQLNTTINDHISDNELNVEELAKLMNMSRPTLYRRIKGVSDSTPNELINKSRLKKAAELLSQRIYTIRQIAAMVGYSVQSNFSRDFHKHFGISPSIYMAMIKD